MNKEEIRIKLISIYEEVLETQIEDKGINDGLIELFHIDSLIALKIIVRIEQEFGIIIEDDNLAIEMIDSIDKAVDYIISNQ